MHSVHHYFFYKNTSKDICSYKSCTFQESLNSTVRSGYILDGLGILKCNNNSVSTHVAFADSWLCKQKVYNASNVSW